MTTEWILNSLAAVAAVMGILYVTHMRDERKWARDAERERLAQAEWERTHPAE
ncbi:hypothetical protein [Brevundimonas sp. TWP2-3-2]|uniref:hypothetical protein n=1 Tax=unclassified Brevundimonas TaxID=2622653 RepID=UPI003CE88BD1